MYLDSMYAGFATAKGELVRSILYPKPIDFKFSQDGAKFILSLALIAIGGMIYTMILMVSIGDIIALRYIIYTVILLVSNGVIFSLRYIIYSMILMVRVESIMC